VFRLPKRQKRDSLIVPHDDPDVSQSLTDMVHSYLELEEQEPKPEEIPNKPASTSPGAPLDHEIEDYVYDIYYRARYVEKQWEGRENVGVMYVNQKANGHE
jgi:hypothetical protein